MKHCIIERNRKESNGTKTKSVLSTVTVLLLVGILFVMPVLSQPLGMVSYWKFDEGSGSAASDFVDANHGTICGASWTTGKVGNALSFNGVDDYVLISHSENLSPTIAIAIEAWIKPYAMEYWLGKQIVRKSDPASYNPGMAERISYMLFVRNLGNYGYEIAFGGFIGGVFQEFRTDTGPLTLSEWNHVAATYDGSIVKLYVNSDCVFEAPCSGEISSYNDPIQIGAAISTSGYTPIEFWNGLIDEVAIHNRALTGEEIQQHYQNGLNGLGYFSDPKVSMQMLIETIETWNLPKGTENSLTSKLQSAIQSLDNGQQNAAINKLNAFINEVKAQRNKKLTNAQADTLITEAQRIINTIQG